MVHTPTVITRISDTDIQNTTNTNKFVRILCQSEFIITIISFYTSPILFVPNIMIIKLCATTISTVLQIYKLIMKFSKVSSEKRFTISRCTIDVVPKTRFFIFLNLVRHLRQDSLCMWTPIRSTTRFYKLMNMFRRIDTRFSQMQKIKIFHHCGFFFRSCELYATLTHIIIHARSI